MISRRTMLSLPLLAGPAAALEVAQASQQGGLLIGRGAQGSRVTLEGRAVRVSPAGEFVLGFGRDHGPEAMLSVNGQPRRVTVAQRQWDVQSISGLPPAQVTPDAATLERIVAERARLAAARAVEGAATHFLAPLAWPARGRISGVYGSQRILNGQPRQPHLGLDVAGPVGTLISAAWAGRVSLAAEFHFFGKLVVLDHGHGVNTLYAHLSSIEVTEGQAVSQGARIGAMGATGRVTGPHLHFSLGWLQTWLDPQPLLPA